MIFFDYKVYLLLLKNDKIFKFCNWYSRNRKIQFCHYSVKNTNNRMYLEFLLVLILDNA